MPRALVGSGASCGGSDDAPRPNPPYARVSGPISAVVGASEGGASEPVRAGERHSPIGEGRDMTMTALTVLAALAAVPLVLGVLMAIALGSYLALKWARG
jgi:hypothetical protein